MNINTWNIDDNDVGSTWRCGSPPNTGQRQRYPGRFWHNMAREYPYVINHEDTLHMFSGSMDWGTTTDIRPGTNADIVAPFDNIDLPDGSFKYVIADPPYHDWFQEDWVNDEGEKYSFPKPKHVLREAARLCKDDGLIFILHLIVIPAYKEYRVEREAIHCLLCGPNNMVRCLNVFRKKFEYDI